MKRHRARRQATSSPEETAPRFRRMQKSDLLQVARIEARVYPCPWTQANFCYSLQAGLCCWVLERRGVIEAYGVMSVELGKAHILNLCVRPASQRCGLGRRMLTHLLDLARHGGADSVMLEVRFSNLPARQLYQSMGFQEVGVHKGYYRLAQGCEDALVMARRLSPGK
jgi:ribosomal-protein-alanine N-acetyltransferase